MRKPLAAWLSLMPWSYLSSTFNCQHQHCAIGDQWSLTIKCQAALCLWLVLIIFIKIIIIVIFTIIASKTMMMMMITIPPVVTSAWPAGSLLVVSEARVLVPDRPPPLAPEVRLVPTTREKTQPRLNKQQITADRDEWLIWKIKVGSETFFIYILFTVLSMMTLVLSPKVAKPKN